MNPDNTPKEIQMDKTMEDVLVEIINKKMDLKKEFIKDSIIGNGVASCAIIAMKEWEALTNKSRDKEIEKLKVLMKLQFFLRREGVGVSNHTINQAWQQFKTENNL